MRPDDLQRLLVIMPTWLGDIVMATPTLRALRRRFADAQIAALLPEPLRAVLEGCPWVDDLLTYQRTADGKEAIWKLAGRLRSQRFDACVLLPNSFRWALAARLAGIPRRIGYDRDGRGLLLTDHLQPPRDGARFRPVPTIDYYLAIAAYLHADTANRHMALFTRTADDDAAQQRLADAGAPPDRRLVLLNPGASYAAKRWPAERFAALADRLIERHGVAVAVTGAPDERDVLDAVVESAAGSIIDLPKLGFHLKLAKSAFKRADLVVTNDTGPRHMAAAFGTPVVTLFGATAPQWTAIDFPDELQVVADAADPHAKVDRDEPSAAMRSIDVDTVCDAAERLLSRTAGRATTAIGPRERER